MLTILKRTSSILISSAFVFFSTTAFAQTVSLTLQDLVETAIAENPQIEVALHQFNQTEGSVTQAKSVYLPHFSAGAAYNRTHVNSLEPVDEDNVGQGMVSGSQLIYDFGRATGLIDSSKYVSDAAKSNLVQYVHDIIFLIKENYFIVLEKERLIEVAEQTVATYEQHLLRAQKYYEAGVRTRIDVTNAEVVLSNAKLERLHATSNLKTSKIKLEQILGSKPNQGDYILLTDDPALNMLAANKPAIRNTLENFLDTASNNRPVLERMGSLIKSSESNLKQVKGNYWPSINATGEYNAYETEITTLQDQWYVGVGLNWDFFSGFQTEGEVAEANSRIRELQASLRELQLSITQDVTDSYLRADENREAVDLADQTLTLATENLDLAEGRYKAGLNDMIEFNDAQLTFSTSQSNLVVTYYSYLTALARIERAVGIMPEFTDEKLNTILESGGTSQQ